MSGPSVLTMLEGEYSTATVDIWESEPLDIVASGEVVVRPQIGSEELFHVASSNPINFYGIHFKGDGIAFCLYTRGGERLIRDCSFSGFSDCCIQVDNSVELQVVDCRFGSADSSMAACALSMSNAPGSQVVDNQFYCEGEQDVVRIWHSGDTIVRNNYFGSPSSPLLVDGWALRAQEGSNITVKDNHFWMNMGNALGVWATQASQTGCRITGNQISYSITPEYGYGICVGVENPQIHRLDEPLVSDNLVVLPQSDLSYFHNLFVGYCISPLVRGNETHGGGYGLGIKGNTDGLVELNHIYYPALQCIIDKAGSYCHFLSNEMYPQAGKAAARVTNDIEAGVPLDISLWNSNGFHLEGINLAFVVDTPVNIIAQGVDSDDNRYYLEESGSPLFRVNGIHYNLDEMQREFGWDQASEFKPLDLPDPNNAADRK
jgi:hypothetical protein